MFARGGTRGRPRRATGASTSRRSGAPPRARARSGRSRAATRDTSRPGSSSVPIAASVMRPPAGASCRSVSWSASTNTGSLVYCAIPFPRRNGRYARSRSRIRQPSIVVSSVSTIARAPAALRARDEARDELVRRAPVELEPARCVAHRPRCLLHRARGLVREDERDALRGSGARDRDVRVAVRHLEDADRAEDERARQRRAEHLGRPCRAIETSRSIRGTMRQRSNAARFSRIVSSVPAPPAT